MASIANRDGVRDCDKKPLPEEDINGVTTSSPVVAEVTIIGQESSIQSDRRQAINAGIQLNRQRAGNGPVSTRDCSGVNARARLLCNSRKRAEEKPISAAPPESFNCRSSMRT